MCVYVIGNSIQFWSDELFVLCLLQSLRKDFRALLPAFLVAQVLVFPVLQLDAVIAADDVFKPQPIGFPVCKIGFPAVPFQGKELQKITDQRIMLCRFVVRNELDGAGVFSVAGRLFRFQLETDARLFV